MSKVLTASVKLQKAEQAVRARLAQYGEDLVKIYEELKVRTQRAFAQNVQYHYDLGQKIIKVHEKYKQGGTKELADALRLNMDSVLKARAFAERYTLEEVQDFVKKNFSWSHVRQYVSLPEKYRLSIPQEAYERGLDVRATAKLIQQKLGRRSQGGRPRGGSKGTPGLVSVLKQMRAMTEKWIEQNDSVWAKDGLPQVSSLSDDEITSDIVADMELLVDNLDMLSKRAAADAEEAKAALRDLRSRAPAAEANNGHTVRTVPSKVVPARVAPAKAARNVRARRIQRQAATAAK